MTFNFMLLCQSWFHQPLTYYLLISLIHGLLCILSARYIFSWEQESIIHNRIKSDIPIKCTTKGVFGNRKTKLAMSNIKGFVFNLVTFWFKIG